MIILSFLYTILSSLWFSAEPNEIEKIDLKLTAEETAFTFLELSSGEATLIQNGHGGITLVNTGGPNTKEILEERLSVYEVSKIDNIIITNIGADYCANLDWLVKEYGVSNVYVSAAVRETMIHAYSLGSVNVVGWNKADKADMKGGLHIDVLHSEEKDEYDKGSLALLMTFGKQKVLYMGLANAAVESSLVNEYELDAQILKVGDFASERGTSQQFIDEVDPQVAVIFRTSERNPSGDVLDRLHETWIDTYLTMQSGNISIKCSNENYKVITIPNESPEEGIS
jgi:competence protein ComEC